MTVADTARVEAKEYRKTRWERIEPVRDCNLGRKESAMRTDKRKEFVLYAGGTLHQDTDTDTGVWPASTGEQQRPTWRSGE